MYTPGCELDSNVIRKMFDHFLTIDRPSKRQIQVLFGSSLSFRKYKLQIKQSVYSGTFEVYVDLDQTLLKGKRFKRKN
jgi:hypothetical protein